MSDKKINHEYTLEIVCPWCGYEYGDSYEYASGEEDIGLLECEECEKHFHATRSITIDYCTEQAKYGTCKHCGANDVVLESDHSTFGKYEDLCSKCGWTELMRLREKWYKENVK